MAYYSGKIIIHNDTPIEYENKFKNHSTIVSMKFSVHFNKNRLYLDNKMISQLLESKAVQNYILKEVDVYIENNVEKIEKAIRTKIVSITAPEIELKVIGKFLHLNIKCCMNHTINDLRLALMKKLRKEKNKIDMLRGE